MLSYRSTWEFVSTLEKSGEALNTSLVYLQIPGASITQHSARTRFIFLYFIITLII